MTEKQEPWRLVHHSNFGAPCYSIKQGDRCNDPIYCTDAADGLHDFDNGQTLQRIVDDHNALAGINPEAVPMMRKALGLADPNYLNRVATWIETVYRESDIRHRAPSDLRRI